MEDEIHEWSPAETVGEFFAWMAKKAQNDNQEIIRKIGANIYKISPKLESLGQAFDQYLKNLYT